MEPSQDFKSLQEGLQKSLVSSTKTVNRIAAEDLEFQRTINPEVAEQLDEKSARVLDLSSRLLKSAAAACGLKAPTLEDAEDIDMNWRGVVDVVDTVLEKADTALDEYTGLIKRKDPPTGDSGSDPKKAKSTAKVVRNANITKPQVNFEVQPDNFPTGPWKPILTIKPHATVPLKKSLVKFTAENGTKQYKHPYETEINEMEYPKRVYKKTEPIPFQPMDDTKPTWVDTYEGVLEMLEHLKKAKEIAVDLEHHDFRTYTGLVSLMQVSTREQDWIVDTLQPWRHKLEVLNEVFADPKIVKVFHGAYMDMVWLQRDLGLYVNGLFDTYFPCELLAYPGRGLAYLLSAFAGFTADKQYQLADWRMRPLPKEMMYYARSDTHYLLHIYDQVRNALIASSDRSSPETDLIQRALDKSKEVSLYRHEHPDFNEKTGEGVRGWYNYILKQGHLALNEEQFAVFRALWQWRDVAARKEDESPNFILGSHNIGQISKVNPPDMKALHSLLPMSPKTARQSLDEIWQLIQATKAEGGPSLVQFLKDSAPETMKRNGKPKPAPAKTSLLAADGEVAVGRLPHSQLFGNMPISSQWEASKKKADTGDDYVPFPWQRFVQEAANGETEEAAPEPMETEPQEANSAKVEEAEEEPDQEFTLKRGKKRKADAAAEEDSSSSEDSESEEEQEADDEPVDDVVDNGVLAIEEEQLAKKPNKKARKAEKKAREAEIGRERAAKKAENKALKAQEKEEKRKKHVESQQASQQKSPAGEDKKFSAVPFDYSQAASVMNASRDAAAANKKAGGKKDKVFDPYTKTAEEGVKGGKKMPQIKGGRSATFKK